MGEDIGKLVDMVREQQLGRRQFLRRALALGLSAGAANALLAACAPSAPSPTAAPAKPAATAAPATQPTVAPTAAPKPAATAAPAATVAPTAAAKPAAQGEKLVVAMNTWGTENPFAWMNSANEKPLWDLVQDNLIIRDPATFDLRPSLATAWTPSNGGKTWTFKLRQGVMFHDTWGEFTSEDVKWTVEQNIKQGSAGGDSAYFRSEVEKIETPDKYTVVLHVKTPTWEMPHKFAQRTGYQGITSKKYVESVGEDKARLNPIGTGPYKYVEGKQGAYHRFQVVPNHWRVAPGFKQIEVRRIADPASALAGLRSGEIDVAQVSGDYLDQAKKAGLRIHRVGGGLLTWIVLPSQVLPGRPDYSPTSPWVGDPNDPKSQENARKVRLALNLAVNKKAIIDGLWRGEGADSPFGPSYFAHYKGFSQDWKVHPYDLARAKQLLAEAGYPNGFEIRVSPLNQTSDGPDLTEAVAIDWEKLGLKVQRVPGEWGTFFPKTRTRDMGRVAWPYSTPGASAEAGVTWQRILHSKGTMFMVAESLEYDKMLDTISAEMDADKRAKVSSELGQKIYDDVRIVMIGVKNATWAVSKKVGDWKTLVATSADNNLEYITYSGQG